MKKILTPIWLVILLFLALASIGQEGKIPTFKMLMTNGQYYTAKDLSEKKPVVLIYFSPDCEHCIKLMDELFKQINELKHAQLILITFKPVEDLRAFEKRYQTAKYPFIKTGTEGNTFYIRYYYKLTTTPFTALFDKKGNLVYSYRKETPVHDLLKRLKALH